MDKLLRLKEGPDVVLSVPEPGKGPSSFLVGLPKAGSTLLNNLIGPISTAAGYQYFPLFNRLKSASIEPTEIDVDRSDSIFEPDGYCYGGFRGLPGAITLPPFADGRTILLVRDPRDMLTSLFFSVAYSHRPPPARPDSKLTANFNTRRNIALSSDINNFVIDRAKTTLSIFSAIENKLAKYNIKTYRYEDVVFDKLNWTNDMIDFLRLDVPGEIVERVVARNDVLPQVEDMREHVRTVAPGDHKRKLTGETIDRLDVMLRPVLTRYAYA